MSGDHPNGNATDNETRMEQALRASELSHHRLFEAAYEYLVIPPLRPRHATASRAGGALS